MSHATSGMPARPVSLDWRHGAIGPLEPCVLCGTSALFRSPVKDVPCPGLRRDLDRHSRAHDASDLARLIRVYTPGRGDPR